MKKPLIISAGLHGILLILAVSDLDFLDSPPLELTPVAEVEVVTEEDLLALMQPEPEPEPPQAEEAPRPIPRPPAPRPQIAEITPPQPPAPPEISRPIAELRAPDRISLPEPAYEPAPDDTPPPEPEPDPVAAMDRRPMRPLASRRPAPAPEPAPQQEPPPPRTDPLAAILVDLENEPEPEEPPQEDPLASVLRNVQQTVTERPAPRPAPLNDDELAALRRQFREQGCWSIPVGMSGLSDRVVTLRMTMGRDRNLVAGPSHDYTSQQLAGDPLLAVLVRSAQNAVLKCQPLALPEGKYDYWRELILHFRPEDYL